MASHVDRKKAHRAFEQSRGHDSSSQLTRLDKEELHEFRTLLAHGDIDGKTVKANGMTVLRAGRISTNGAGREDEIAKIRTMVAAARSDSALGATPALA